MEWAIPSSVVCMLGPGNSTKSTILDAIEHTLAPRWYVPFEDCDFYLGDTSNPIEIIVTVGQVPSKLLSDEKFGLYLRGWSEAAGLRDEPQGNDEPVLSIRLYVDESLEPQWTVINERAPDGRRISSTDRELLGLTRLGSYVDRHLSWSKGSSLSHLTSAKSNASSILAEANRMAQKAVRTGITTEFKEVAKQAQDMANSLAVQHKSEFVPALDPKGIDIGSGAISIYEGNVPVRLGGLGDRRLVALGLQLLCVSKGAILLIDEVEYALEPYRIRHLLQKLQQLTGDSSSSAGQVIMTSHNHTVVVELASEKLCVVRSKDGTTTVIPVGKALQSIVRSVPESVLSRKILVCEGKTEYGLCRSLDNFWATEEHKRPFAFFSVTIVEGGGHSAPQRARELVSLGYDVCLFIDSDKIDELQTDIQTLSQNGVEVIYWEGKVAIEERIALDLPWEAVRQIVDLAVKLKDEQSVFDTICTKLKSNRNSIGTDIDEWKKQGYSENTIRKAIGESAKEGKWFKRVDYGEQLGKIVTSQLNKMPENDLKKKIQALSKWVYGKHS
ncbi:MAG: family ATPase [Acidobacteriota bacterium]|nr:family ATPase [Acidobacteriota bacterium]